MDNNDITTQPHYLKEYFITLRHALIKDREIKHPRLPLHETLTYVDTLLAILLDARVIE